MTVIRASICSRERPPSGTPSALETPELVVAIAGNPSVSAMRALAPSQALSNSSGAGPACSARRRSAAAWFATATLARRAAGRPAPTGVRMAMLTRLYALIVAICTVR